MTDYDPDGLAHVSVFTQHGRTPEAAIDELLSWRQLKEGWSAGYVWAVRDAGIQDWMCRAVGNFRRGDCYRHA